MIRRPPRSTPLYSSAASDVYKRQAMNRGIICVGGGEPESYDIIGERKLKPIINVTPSYESVFHEIERLVLNPNLLNRLKIESVEYVRQHHDYIKVAKQYESIYRKFL